jgi:methionyl-tRNA formyltransferase
VTRRARTVFLGSGAFAVPILSALADHPLAELAGVVTAPTRPGSRGRPTDPPVASRTAELGLPMLRPERLRAQDAVAEIRGLEPDLLVLADYGQIVPSSILEVPRFGALNLHPSLLPRWRGASPIPAAIMAGDRETGVSLMVMDAGLDTGPLVAQRRLALRGDETAPELEDRLATMAAELLAESLRPWLDGELERRPQTDEGATLTRPLRREDGRIDPSRGAADLERQVRAFQPWPGSHFDTPTGRVIVWKARAGEVAPSGAVGRLLEVGDGGLALATADGLLELLEAQPAGGRRMSGADLLRGRPSLAGSAVIEPPPAGTAASR